MIEDSRFLETDENNSRIGHHEIVIEQMSSKFENLTFPDKPMENITSAFIDDVLVKQAKDASSVYLQSNAGN